MSVKQTRIRKSARVLNLILKVFLWIETGLAIVCGLAFIASFIAPENIFTVKGGQIAFSFDNALYFNINDSLAFSLKPLIQAGAPFGIGILTIMIIATREIANILKSVMDNNPFAEENAKRLTVIAIDIFASSIVVNAARFLFTSYMIDLLDISLIRANFSLDPTLVLTGFLILILAGVFKYGNYLKREYDATL